MREALAELTDTVRRADREPATTVVTTKDGTSVSVIAPGGFGRRVADPWSLPSGQTMNLPGELTTAAARWTRFTGSMSATRHEGERPMPMNIRAADGQRDLRRTVAHWAAILLAAGRLAPQLWTTQSLAAWMERQLSWIRLQEWSTEMLDDVRAANNRALRVIDRPADRLYLGVCGQPNSDNQPPGSCGSELIASPGDSIVHCHGCGTAVGVAQRRGELMDAAMGMWMTAGEIERLSGALAGDQAGLRVKRTTVLMWHQRGQIVGDRVYAPKDPADPQPPARFLLRDVLAMAQRSTRRRSTRAA